MEKIIKDSMNDKVLESAYNLFGIDKSLVKYIGGFENIVYSFQKNDKEYILRFVHSSHRSYEQVEAEIEFIDYLDMNDASVSTIVLSLNNNIVEKIVSNNTYFSVSVFSKAPGGTIKKEQITDKFLYSFGREIGKLHVLTKTYKPKYIRIQWYDENYINIGKRVLKGEERKIIVKLEEIVNKLKKVNPSADSYGLIHADLHFGNIFINEDSMTFFDWDDSSYQPFINEFAVITFSAVVYSDLSTVEKSKKANKFLVPLFKGYNEINKLESECFDYFHLFLKYREAVMYIMFKAAGEKVLNSPFAKRYLDGRYERIMNDIPILDMEIVLKDIL